MFRGPNRLISLDLSFEARFPKCSGKQKEMAAQALKKSGRGPLVPRHLRLAGPVFTDGDQRAQLYPRNQTYHTSYWQVPTICGSLYRPSYHRCRHMCWASNGGRSHASSSYSNDASTYVKERVFNGSEKAWLLLSNRTLLCADMRLC